MLKKNKAFTLIEMIIVTAVLCVISLGVYSTFNNGLKIWYRLNKESPKQDLYVFFDKFASDIRNSMKFKTISFSGQDNQLDFAALVDSPNLRKKSVGSVAYFYDPKIGSVYREERDFSCVYSGAKGVVKEALKSIKSMKFQYYTYDIERKAYIWQDVWFKENMPLAVWLEVQIADGDNVFNFSKTVNIPVAG